jgi:hypothetical protein
VWSTWSSLETTGFCRRCRVSLSFLLEFEALLGVRLVMFALRLRIRHSNLAATRKQARHVRNLRAQSRMEIEALKGRNERLWGICGLIQKVPH